MTWFLAGFAAGAAVVLVAGLVALRVATAIVERDAHPLEWLRGRHR